MPATGTDFNKLIKKSSFIGGLLLLFSLSFELALTELKDELAALVVVVMVEVVFGPVSDKSLVVEPASCSSIVKLDINRSSSTL